jgi:hypothetical protein
LITLTVRLAEAAGYLDAIGRKNASAAVLEAIEIIRAVPYGTDIHAALWNIQDGNNDQGAAVIHDRV